MEKGKNMKTNLKRVFSLVLAILMLLPIFSALTFAKEYVDVTNVPENIAYAADITVTEGLTWTGWKPEYLVDGDQTTGTYTPRGKTYAITLTFAEAYYFSDFVVALNREGTLPEITTVPEKFSNTTEKIQILAYNGTELVYESAVIDVAGKEEISTNIWKEADRIVVKGPDISESPSACEAIWEIEAYARTTPGSCNAEIQNVANEALFSALQWVTDNQTKERYLANATWWAMDTDKLFDGDIHTGTKSVKNREFIYQLDFGSERMFSSVRVVTNGAGYVLNDGYLGCEQDEQGNVINYTTHYTGYQMRVYAYDFNDDLVFESDLIDVSSLEEVTFNIGANASIIQCEVSGAGNTGYNGNTIVWEIEAFEETGSHALEQVATKNPSCVATGYIEYACQAPGCGYAKKVAVEATGFHTWSDTYTLITEPENNENGVAQYACKVCSQTINRDIPATGHNWDNGVVTAPDCENEGFTKYTCTDAGCDMSYTADFVTALGHDYDDGVVTRKQTIDSTGLLVYTCQKCNGTKEKVLRKSRYTDKTFKVDNSIVTKYESSQTSSSSYAEDAFQVLGKYIFDGVTNEGIRGLDVQCNYWFAPGERKMVDRLDENGEPVRGSDGKVVQDEVRKSGFLYIYLDREYYFTRGTLYAAANWKWLEVHFEYQDSQGNWVRSATYAHDRLNNMTVSGLDMTGSLNGGARASRIVIESVNGDAGYAYGKVPVGSPAYAGRLQFHEIVLEAHACDVSVKDHKDYQEGQSIADATWNNATCTKDGSCEVVCPVCNVAQNVTLPKEEYGHKYGTVTETVAPTCSNTGIGTAKCTQCNYTRNDIPIEKTGEHNYSKVVTYVSPTCDAKGIEHLTCIDCGDVGLVTPIEPTGIHKFDWIVKSSANYTAEGTTIHACVYCLELSGLEKDIIEEKLPIPEGFIKFNGFEVRMTDFVGLRAKFTYDIAILEELQNTCDVTITVNITDKNGNTKSVEILGKNGTKKYDKETGEFSVVVKSSCTDEFTFSYSVKLRNFRGTVTQDFEVNGGAATSVYDIAQQILDAGITVPADVKKLYQEIVAER